MSLTLSPELDALAKTAITQIAKAEGVEALPKIVEVNVRCAIEHIFDHEARVKRRSSPDTSDGRERRRQSYLQDFAKADPAVAQRIVDLAMK